MLLRLGPRQCVLLSLDNHGAFRAHAPVQRLGEEAPEEGKITEDQSSYLCHLRRFGDEIGGLDSGLEKPILKYRHFCFNRGKLGSDLCQSS